MVRIDIMTLFDETVGDMMNESILGRAQERDIIRIEAHQIRDYTLNKQKQTDDYPYGGGCGMVLYAQPIADCLRTVQKEVAEQAPGPAYRVLDGGRSALHRRARPQAGPVR